MIEVLDSIMLDVATAMRVARVKHGPLTREPVRACAILGREWGEAMNEALLLTTNYVPDGLAVGPDETMDDVRRRWHAQRRDCLYAELAQVAATAIIMMDGLRDGGNSAR